MRVTTSQLREMKAKGEKIAMLTAYDYSTAKVVEEAGVPVILVGDSLGMVVLGYENTLSVTLDDMIHHTKAVVRGTKTALVVGDLPFMTYNVSLEETMRHAARLIQEAGAQAVKLEGGVAVTESVRRLTEAGIPVMGHIGLTPQSINQLGGYKVQGRSAVTARQLLEDAEALEKAGVFSMVLECVPAELATLVTQRVSVPTIGIGAGAGCDGQVQVVHDMLGLFSDFIPRHSKRYATIADTIQQAVKGYVGEVQRGEFPTEKHCWALDPKVLEELTK
jgi:3-methyl-2-oxobutanoate hydroxymethyltransferase